MYPRKAVRTAHIFRSLISFLDSRLELTPSNQRPQLCVWILQKDQELDLFSASIEKKEEEDKVGLISLMESGPLAAIFA